MDIADALRFVDAHDAPGTLVTLHADGRPQVSVVTAVVVDGKLWISATQTRVKTRNIRRDPRVVFVAGTAPWVAIEGRADIREDEETVLDDLRTYYRKAAGEHPDWNEYDDAMIRDLRVIIEIEPSRAYGNAAD